MKKTNLLIVLCAVLASLLLLSACGGGASGNNVSQGASSDAASGDVTITHALGTATLAQHPATVVVFDYGTLDTLDRLGIEVAAVPKATLPPYLGKYNDAKYEDAGTLFEPDFEKLNKLKPDVILIGARTASVYKELNNIAPTIQTSVDAANYVSSFQTNAKAIGQLFGKEAEVDAELAQISAAAEELKSKAASAGKALIILTTGGEISAYGPDSRFGIIHEAFGFEPADAAIEVSTHGQSVSNEYILEKNPDILFVIDRDAAVSGEGATPSKDIIENDLVKQTNAYKNGNIVYLDPGYWYLSGGGLVSEAEMVKEAAAAVQ